MIKAQDLNKVFDNRAIAGIHHVSMELKNGEIFALLGPNGSGKTTLLNLLSGSLKSDSGNISVDGAISRYPTQQDFPSMNVQKFLVQSVKLDIDDDKKIQLARDLADTFEFTFQLRQNLNELSSGQRQKVLLSRELINRPSLLLMDEPFTHLDPFTRKDILNGLFGYIRSQGTTVLWVTHDLDEAFKFSDKIGVLNFGKFEQMGTPVDLIRNPKNLFVAQFLGYRNFFPVKQENGKWTSLWGELPYAVTDKEHAILVVPDQGWIKNTGNIKFLIEERYAGKQSLEYECRLGEQKVFLSRSPMEELFETGLELAFTPELSQAFVIPL